MVEDEEAARVHGPKVTYRRVAIHLDENVSQ